MFSKSTASSRGVLLATLNLAFFISTSSALSDEVQQRCLVFYGRLVEISFSTPDASVQTLFKDEMTLSINRFGASLLWEGKYSFYRVLRDSGFDIQVLRSKVTDNNLNFLQLSKNINDVVFSISTDGWESDSDDSNSLQNYREVYESETCRVYEHKDVLVPDSRSKPRTITQIKYNDDGFQTQECYWKSILHSAGYRGVFFSPLQTQTTRENHLSPSLQPWILNAFWFAHHVIEKSNGSRLVKRDLLNDLVDRGCEN